MSFRIHSAYSSNAIGPIQTNVSVNGFFQTAQISGDYFTGFSGSIDFKSFKDVLVEAQAALQAIFPQGNSTIRYDWNTNRIILSSSVTASYQFNSAAQNVFGFNASYPLGTTIITGSKEPYYIWISTNPERSDDTEVYEAEQIYTERMADSGRVYSVGQSRTCFFRDWSFNLEPKANVFFDQAVSPKYFTYEVFLKELRKGPTPFVVFDDTIVSSPDWTRRDGLYEMRQDGYVFQPEQVMPNYFDYWDVKFQTRLLSRPNQTQEEDFSTNPIITEAELPALNDIFYWADPTKGILLHSNATPNNLYLQTLTEQSNDKLVTDGATDYNPFLQGVSTKFWFRADTQAYSTSWIDNVGLNSGQTEYQLIQFTQSNIVNAPQLTSSTYSDVDEENPIQQGFLFGPNRSGSLTTGSYFIASSSVATFISGSNVWYNIRFPIHFLNTSSYGFIFGTHGGDEVSGSLNVYCEQTNSAGYFLKMKYHNGGVIEYRTNSTIINNQKELVRIQFSPTNLTSSRIEIGLFGGTTIITNSAKLGIISGSSNISLGATYNANSLKPGINAIIPEFAAITYTNPTIQFLFDEYYFLKRYNSLVFANTPNHVGLFLTGSNNISALNNIKNQQYVIDFNHAPVSAPQGGNISNKYDLRYHNGTNLQEGYSLIFCGVKTNFFSSSFPFSPQRIITHDNAAIIDDYPVTDNILTTELSIYNSGSFLTTLNKQKFTCSSPSTVIINYNHPTKTYSTFLNGNLVGTITDSFSKFSQDFIANAQIPTKFTTVTSCSVQMLDGISYLKSLSSDEMNQVFEYTKQKYNIDYTPIPPNLDLDIPPITSSLEFWGDLTSGNTIISGSNLVQRIGDRSGKERHFTAITSSNYLSYNSSDSNFGNKPSMISFGSTGSLLNSTPYPIINSTKRTIAMVFRVPSTGNQGRIYSGQIGGINSTISIEGLLLPNIIAARYANPLGVFTEKTFAINYDTTYRLIVGYDISSGANAIPKMMLNGVLGGTYINTNASAGTNFGSTLMGVMSDPFAGSNGNQQVATILDWSREFSESEMIQLDNWLKAKYNLS